MAISNFTNFLSDSFFSIFTPRVKHEKISYSPAQKSPELFVSLVNSSALSMISRTYFFKHNTDNPVFKGLPLGNCRVLSVLINEHSCPELLLLEPDSDNPNFYRLDDLVVFHEVIAIG